MDVLLLFLVLAVLITLVFDFTNGFHDASNIIATIIASRAMTPTQAVLIVAGFEFLGPVLGGTAVANTIGKFIDLGDVEAIKALLVILAGLVAATLWNLFTWMKGIPSSSSHALVGGLIGAVIISVGPEHVVWGFSQLSHGHFTGVTKVLLALVLSPIIGFSVGFFLQRFMMLLLRAAKPTINKTLRRGQWVTAAGLAFSHGANDAQKSMGILTLILLLSGYISEFVVPLWVIAACATAMTLGVLMGGWRIVRTLGFSIYKIRPIHAFNSQLTACSVIFTASLIGAPVSTTHVVGSSIMGIGASDRPKAVKWKKAKEILTTWGITIPLSALVASIAYFLINTVYHAFILV